MAESKNKIKMILVKLVNPKNTVKLNGVTLQGDKAKYANDDEKTNSFIKANLIKVVGKSKQVVQHSPVSRKKAKQ